MAEVIATEEFTAWYESLDENATKAVLMVVDLLEARGVTLPFPFSSAIQGSRYALRELRQKAGHQQLRVIYAFDPKRQAVLLLGGDKTGDDRFYEWVIPQAERVWERYLKEMA
jgi:hypothetical protein